MPGSSQEAKAGGGRITGIRSWIGATTALAVVVRRAQVSSTCPSGERHASQIPVKGIGAPAYQQRSLELLRARSLLGRAGDDYLALADPGRPDHGHGSNRLAFGLGWRDDDFYQELRLRPAYHNLLDRNTASAVNNS